MLPYQSSDPFSKRPESAQPPDVCEQACPGVLFAEATHRQSILISGVFFIEATRPLLLKELKLGGREGPILLTRRTSRFGNSLLAIKRVPRSPKRSALTGLICALLAYASWGLLPLYWKPFGSASPLENREPSGDLVAHSIGDSLGHVSANGRNARRFAERQAPGSPCC